MEDKLLPSVALTVGVGALERFERHFGALWGHGKDEELTESERRWRDAWQAARGEILDHTHGVIRRSEGRTH